MPNGFFGGGGIGGIFGGGGGAGENIGGGIGGVGGAIVGGAMGAKIGSWAGRKLGALFRGRRSPEEFVDDMIAEGRVPEAMLSIMTRDRLIATERQSRGAGAALDLMTIWLNDAIAAFESGDAGRISADVQHRIDHAGENRQRAASEPGKNLFYLMNAEVLDRIVQLMNEAMEHRDTYPPGDPGAGGFGGIPLPPPPGQKPGEAGIMPPIDTKTLLIGAGAVGLFLLMSGSR